MARKLSLPEDPFFLVDELEEVEVIEVEIPEEPRTILMPELIGFAISRCRQRAGVLQEDLAERVNWAQSLVSKLERGDVTVSIEQLHKMTLVINEGLRARGLEKVRPWDLIEDAYDLAHLVRVRGYRVIWSTGPVCKQPALRGRKLVRWLRELDPED